MKGFMENKALKHFVANFFKKAGIAINGSNPWDILVNDDRFYAKLVSEKSVGLGEAYMDNWIDCDAIDIMVDKLCRSGALDDSSFGWNEFLNVAKAVALNPQTYLRSFEVGKRHYDLGDDIFEAMLDTRMIYSCAYWKNAGNLDQAQEAKLELICQKLKLEPGMKVLDVGCGWGGFAQYAASKYGVSVVGITVSKNQLERAKKRNVGLPVEIKFEDYRETRGSFDRIVSVGQFEHVGYKNYDAYMNQMANLLNKDGLFLLHTIGGNISRTYGDPWIVKYIFPNSMIPSMVQICRSFEGKFIMEDWHNFGSYYDKTLMAWEGNFENNWAKLSKSYPEKFYRMWRFYLLSCAGAFRSRSLQLWQIILTKEGLVGGYSSIR